MSEILIARKKETPRGEFKTPARDVYVYFDSKNNDTFGAGVCQMPPGSNNEKHAHADADEVIYVISGTMKIVVEGQENTLEQGDAIMLKRNQVHQIFNPSESETLIHTFTFAGTKPADAIGSGYGNDDNFTVYPPGK